MIRFIKERGIVLVTTLLTIVLVVMMITVIVNSGAAGLSLTANFRDRESALMAAESGLQYATTRLQENITWRGDGTVVNNDPNFVVKEDNGNVFGIITSKLGTKSAFRIKFNVEDGSPSVDASGKIVPSSDGDGLPDPKSLTIPSKFVSLNNMFGTTAVAMYRANPNGKHRLDNSFCSLPAGTTAVVVEGIAGPGVRDVEINYVGAFSNVSTRIVEAYLSVDGVNGMDSAAYAAGSLNAYLANNGNFNVKSNDEDNLPRMRSLSNINILGIKENKGDVSLGKAKFNIGDGEVVVRDGNTFKLNTNQQSEGVTYGDSQKQFKKITWAQIHKATAQDTNLDAGTYVWRQGESGPTLVYYPGEYPPGKALPATGGQPVVLPSNGTIIMDPASMSLLISNNVYVNANNGFSGLVVRTDDSITDGRPFVGFVPPGEGQQSSVLTASGNITLQGGVMGTGSVTSEGSITFEGPSVLESDPDTGVSLYAQGDINLEAITQVPSSQKVKGALNTITGTAQHNHGTEVTAKGMGRENLSSGFLVCWKCGHWQWECTCGSSTPDPNPTPTQTPAPDPNNPVSPIDGSPTAPDEGGETGQLETPTDITGPEDVADVILEPDGDSEASLAEVTDETTFTPTIPEQLIAGQDTEAYVAKKKAQLKELISRHEKVTYADQDISGVIYTWGNFNVNVGTNSLLNITGTVIAYGADPTSSNPTAGSASNRGQINIRAKNVDLTYDPRYVKELLGSASDIRIKRTLWATW